LSFKVVIPARFDSTRLPGKVLRLLAGKPLIEWVYLQALKSNAEEIIIATDHAKVADSAKNFGAKICLTSVEHSTGTDRLAEVVMLNQWSDDVIVINIQGDEPLILPSLIDRLAEILHSNPSAAIATLATPIDNRKDQFDPNCCKVVLDKNQRALYFSRAAIPYNRDQFSACVDESQAVSNVYRHIGVYAYRAGFLKKFAQMDQCYLEQIEALEQLRALYNGYEIVVELVAEPPGHGVDTEEDLQRVEVLLSK